MGVVLAFPRAMGNQLLAFFNGRHTLRCCIGQTSTDAEHVRQDLGKVPANAARSVPDKRFALKNELCFPVAQA
jgi:hypothetical protein